MVRRLDASLRQAPLESAAALERLAYTLAHAQEGELASGAKNSAFMIRENHRIFTA